MFVWGPHKTGETFFLWVFGIDLQNVCKITLISKLGSIIFWFHYNQRFVGTLKVPNIFSIKGACCHSVMQLSSCLYHPWEPFSLLDFIACEFCFIWLCSEVFVKWSVLWSKVPQQFHVSNHGLVTVAWYSSKICLFCTVGIEADMYDCYQSVCMVSLWCWMKKYLMLCFLWSGCHEHYMY